MIFYFVEQCSAHWTIEMGALGPSVETRGPTVGDGETRKRRPVTPARSSDETPLSPGRSRSVTGPPRVGLIRGTGILPMRNTGETPVPRRVPRGARLLAAPSSVATEVSDGAA